MRYLHISFFYIIFAISKENRLITLKIKNNMKRITSVTELKKGDKIVRVTHLGEYEIIEFLCIHPYNEEYSLFLNQNKDGMPKFYNGRLKGEEWYLYDRKNDFNEVIDMRIELLNKHIEKLKTLKEKK
jgi:hypothetical protein